jgi:serine protease Do
VKPATRARPFLPLIAGAALLFAACTNAPAQGAATPTSPISPVPPLDAGSEPYAAVAARVLPSVVNVTTNVYQATSTGAPEQGKGIGTGFIVRSNGVVVTNCHVVQGASRITVFTSEDEPTRYDARVIGGDCEHDLAVLKVDAEGLPTIRFGASAGLRLGQQVVAIGYALALEGGPSVTTGIVSSLDRTIRVQDPQCTVCSNGVRTYSEVIQTDAAINHGNSGGPLVDMAGRVVGINSAGSDSAENIGFAIAIDSVKAAIDSAISDPLRATAYLGISTRSVTADLAFQLDLPVEEGALVQTVTSGSPAGKAGLHAGSSSGRGADVIVSVDGRSVTSADDVVQAVSEKQPGDSVEIEYYRGNDKRTVTVKLGERPEQVASTGSQQSPDDDGGLPFQLP